MVFFSKQKLTAEQIQERGIVQWPVWEKEISRFEWYYDETEECLFLDGEVTIETEEGRFNILPGDFVTFYKGLHCIWDIRKPVRKHYNFI
jgi:hypothetical protein